MKILNIFFKSKKKKNEQELLKQYEDGKVLQVNNSVDNKEFFKKKIN